MAPWQLKLGNFHCDYECIMENMSTYLLAEGCAGAHVAWTVGPVEAMVAKVVEALVGVACRAGTDLTSPSSETRPAQSRWKSESRHDSERMFRSC